MIVRDPSPPHEAAWRKLWSGYNAFYSAIIPSAVTDATWRRILDPSSTISARLAEDNGDIVGFAVCVVHEGTWTIDPVCYLEDLFVEPDHRGRGVGRLLIQDAVDRARVAGCSRFYWHTRADNPARQLYDQFVKADGFVRYRMLLE